MRRILNQRDISTRMSRGDMIESGGESGIKEDRDGQVSYGIGLEGMRQLPRVGQLALHQ